MLVSAGYRKTIYWYCIMALGLLSVEVLAAGVEKDERVAAAEEVKKEAPEEIFARSEEAMNNADVKKAMDLAIEAAKQNYVPAQVFLGEYYDYADYNEMAFGWFMTAAYQGNPRGAFGLAKLYASGEGVEANFDKAFFWFRFAAEKGHLGAVQVIASAYRKGQLGQKVDLEQAKLWEGKIPALEEEQKKERARIRKLAELKAKEAQEKLKAAREESIRKYLEEKKLEESKSSEPVDGVSEKTTEQVR